MKQRPTVMNAPRGVRSSGRIGLGLMPAERAEVQKISASNLRTEANTARLLLLAGLQAIRKGLVPNPFKPGSIPPADHGEAI